MRPAPQLPYAAAHLLLHAQARGSGGAIVGIPDAFLPTTERFGGTPPRVIEPAAAWHILHDKGLVEGAIETGWAATWRSGATHDGGETHG